MFALTHLTQQNNLNVLILGNAHAVSSFYLQGKTELKLYSA